jgi:hypothetical protein
MTRSELGKMPHSMIHHQRQNTGVTMNQEQMRVASGTALASRDEFRKLALAPDKAGAPPSNHILQSHFASCTVFRRRDTEC